MAREGSSGVENTFDMRTRPSSAQTQSVKVPPVSTATRSSSFCSVEPGMLAQQTLADGHHAGNDTESGKHIGRGFHKRRSVADAVRLLGELAKELLRDKRVCDHGQDDADYEERNAQ